MLPKALNGFSANTPDYSYHRGCSLNFNTSIEAGTPVFIKMNDGATQLNFSEADKAIAPSMAGKKTDKGQITDDISIKRCLLPTK